jgi:hypothetical protein
VLVADRFPATGDPLVDFASMIDGARIEARARPQSLSATVARELQIAYREDDGSGVRVLALVRIAVRHPLRCVLDVLRRPPGQPKLAALAPAVLRLERAPGARVHALGGEDARITAQRLAALAGHEVGRI